MSPRFLLSSLSLTNDLKSATQLPPVDQPQTPVAELIDYQHGRAKLDGQPMSVVTACGPFTIDDDLSYAPFAALMEEMANLRPDLLILVCCTGLMSRST